MTAATTVPAAYAPRAVGRVSSFCGVVTETMYGSRRDRYAALTYPRRTSTYPRAKATTAVTIRVAARLVAASAPSVISTSPTAPVTRYARNLVLRGPPKSDSTSRMNTPKVA